MANRQLFSLPVDPWRLFSSSTTLVPWQQLLDIRQPCACQANMTHSERGPHQRAGARDHQRERGGSSGGNTGVHLFSVCIREEGCFVSPCRENQAKARQAVIDLWQDYRCLPPLLACVRSTKGDTVSA